MDGANDKDPKSNERVAPESEVKKFERAPGRRTMDVEILTGAVKLVSHK